ncbi:hypothetical protein OIU76_025911 [Salix suchowensis]|nr:hypothetical protein OIU76_025911 [Salix suchowensis]
MAAEIGAVVGDWWQDINESTQWQDGIFYTLCAAYALVSSVALIQFIRIELRVPENGLTTQKVFHFMNFIVNAVRAVAFGFHKQVFIMHPKALVLIFLNLPGLLFFSTYTLLVLFWAETNHQASFIFELFFILLVLVNAAMYFIQELSEGLHLGVPLDRRQQCCGINWKDIYCSGVNPSCIRLHDCFFLLRRFPIDSTGRTKKLHEVGSVTAICFTCFLIRCFMVSLK